MKNLLNSKHRSLFMFLVSVAMIYFGYYFIVHFISLSAELLLKKEEVALLKFEHFATLLPLAISLYVWIGATICSIILIFKDLKFLNEKDLIGGLIRGLIVGLIAGLIVGLIVGLIGSPIAGLIGSLIAGLIMGLIMGLIGGLNGI